MPFLIHLGKNGLVLSITIFAYIQLREAKNRKLEEQESAYGAMVLVCLSSRVLLHNSPNERRPPETSPVEVPR